MLQHPHTAWSTFFSKGENKKEAFNYFDAPNECVKLLSLKRYNVLRHCNARYRSPERRRRSTCEPPRKKKQYDNLFVTRRKNVFAISINPQTSFNLQASNVPSPDQHFPFRSSLSRIRSLLFLNNRCPHPFFVGIPSSLFCSPPTRPERVSFPPDEVANRWPPQERTGKDSFIDRLSSRSFSLSVGVTVSIYHSPFLCAHFELTFVIEQQPDTSSGMCLTATPQIVETNLGSLMLFR